ncbi:hypothetical protein BCF11_0459 [Collimonas sp. PA-H2]|uniref:hypothetical protein n=1 Tax=Collimonas sp. PA-H2 TaxID=1881062 RepID=UPI000C01ED5C|nr:hypothetical protein [Collimonas sp. PA-H2]PFH08107.1 hypothetical protein BCF11_0459 [Collimonas sp. PA-H2]
MKTKFALTMTLFTLVACGGGGGSDNATTSTPPATNTPPVTVAPPVTSPPPATTPPPTAVIGEVLPSLTNPEPGSTAATGNGVEGIWKNTSSFFAAISFIDSQNNLSAINVNASAVPKHLFGVISTTSSGWSLISGLETSDFFFNPTTSGSGTYVAKQSFAGSYMTSSANPTNFSWVYDPANALAVTQNSVAGTWSQSRDSLVIASDGTFTGTFISCNVSGTLSLASPGTSKNLYQMTLTAAAGNTSACQIPVGLRFTGNTGITFVPLIGNNGFLRSIPFLLKSDSNTKTLVGQLTKQ